MVGVRGVRNGIIVCFLLPLVIATGSEHTVCHTTATNTTLLAHTTTSAPCGTTVVVLGAVEERRAAAGPVAGAAVATRGQEATA